MLRVGEERRACLRVVTDYGATGTLGRGARERLSWSLGLLRLFGSVVGDGVDVHCTPWWVVRGWLNRRVCAGSAQGVVILAVEVRMALVGAAGMRSFRSCVAC